MPDPFPPVRHTLSSGRPRGHIAAAWARLGWTLALVIIAGGAVVLWELLAPGPAVGGDVFLGPPAAPGRPIAVKPGPAAAGATEIHQAVGAPPVVRVQAAVRSAAAAVTTPRAPGAAASGSGRRSSDGRSGAAPTAHRRSGTRSAKDAEDDRDNHGKGSAKDAHDTEDTGGDES